MKLMLTFARSYPMRSAITLTALLFSGLAEGLGISALLPLLNLVLGTQTGAINADTTGTSEMGAMLEQKVRSLLEVFGLGPTVGVLLIVFVAGILLKCVLMLLANRQVGYTVAHIATDLRLMLLRALFVTRWEYFIRQPAGQLTNAVATEADRSANAYFFGARFSAIVITAIVYAVLALIVSWKTSLIAVAAGSFIILILRRLVRKARRAGERQTELLQSLLANMTDSLQSIKPIKAMARGDSVDSMLMTKTQGLNRSLQKQVFHREALKALQEPLFTVFMAFGLFVALVHLKLPLASVMITIYLIGRVVKQMQKAQSEYQHMAICDSAYWSLKSKIHEAEKEREEICGMQTPSLRHSIRLEQVSFAYGERWILKNASLTFPAGLFTAIVGPSGAGKTTVADLVTGLLRPQEGEVWIDDLPLKQIDLRNWRRMIGYVPQETILLHDSVFTNVTLGDEQLQPQDVEYALQAAGAWEFIMDLPEGMDSIVGERGHKLSGGQRQRIAIARALVHRPKLLILDEATTALDPDNEAAICQTLRKLRGDITILSISHQPAILEAADQAYRVEGGMVAPVDICSKTDLPPGEEAAESGTRLQVAQEK